MTSEHTNQFIQLTISTNITDVKEITATHHQFGPKQKNKRRRQLSCNKSTYETFLVALQIESLNITPSKSGQHVR